MTKPKFPIIKKFEGDNVVYGCTEEKEYGLCDLTFVDKNKNAIVIDSDGRLFRIDYATQTGWGTWFWGYHPLFKGRLAKVTYSYKEIRDMTWGEFSAFLTEHLSKKVDPMWYPNPKKRILAQLERTSSFQDIIEMFSYERD